jgi:hypothetical protein
MKVVLSGRVLGFLLATCAIAGVSLAHHSWENYHWKRTTPQVTLLVGDNVSQVWDEYLDEAIDDWNPSKYIQLTKTTGNAKSKRCRAILGRIEVCSGNYGDSGWLGIAQIWVNEDHIVQGTTKINDFYFNQEPYNTPSWRELVMCQEIAHDFGLDHQDEIFENGNLGSCMDYTDNPDGPPSNVDPNTHDFQELEIIYTHSHGDTQFQINHRPPPAFFDIDPDTPRNWGRLLRSSRTGRSQDYVLDFGQGNKIITHVFWHEPPDGVDSHSGHPNGDLR